MSILLTQSQWKVSNADKMWMQNADAAWAGIWSNLAKEIIRVYKNEINGR